MKENRIKKGRAGTGQFSGARDQSGGGHSTNDTFILPRGQAPRQFTNERSQIAGPVGRLLDQAIFRVEQSRAAGDLSRAAEHRKVKAALEDLAFRGRKASNSASITGRQAAYLSQLIAKRGKQRYQAAKRRLGLAEITILELSKSQAARLIAELAGKDGRR